MTNFLSFQVHGGGIGGGVAANVASLLEFLESLAGKTPPEMFSAILPGLAGLENIHPLFVHFPIAFFAGFFLVDFLGVATKKAQWRYVASWLLYLGTISAIFTVIAGLFAADSVEHGEDVHALMERHEHIGVAVLSLSLFLSGWRLKLWGLHSATGNTAFLGLAGFLCALLFLGADLGGLMVYQHGVSVNSGASSETKSEDMGGQDGHNHDKPALNAQDAHSDDHGANGHDHSGGGHHHDGHHHGGDSHSH